ncbi:hypothetical protein H6G33_34825 [Calothrix sp. FACHB-1219]|uniref:hypothetical protein n=1 Tax=unclassified Calothrix TaxID=2619626 RepID=UPI001689576D|nr:MULTISPECIES: hypothetical protein [unclassified Calothrix]MBD2207516.1 hypothetical protein [Calothrix sp. FACHB-168]MBD2222117.1 hypothetical protein [Calothrix sp. FACHB-1219]
MNDGEKKANIFLNIFFSAACKLKLPQISFIGAQKFYALRVFFITGENFFGNFLAKNWHDANLICTGKNNIVIR